MMHGSNSEPKMRAVVDAAQKVEKLNMIHE